MRQERAGSLRGDRPFVKRWRRRTTRIAGLILATGLAGCGSSRLAPTVRVRMTGAQIATELVDSWLKDAREYAFETSKPVNPVWSQVGFDALARGDCDVACTDRPITLREVRSCQPREVLGYRVGFYGYALYVHASNPVDSIYAEHLGGLFQKKIVDWKEFGGPQLPDLAGPIKLYGPRKTTRGGMILMKQARIWFAEPTWTPLDSDAQIVARVAADPLALGFAGIGYDNEQVRYLGLRMQRAGTPVFPSLEEIESERYGLAKVIYVYCVAPPNPAAAAVVEYLFSDAGARAMETTAVWPIPRDRALVRPQP